MALSFAPVARSTAAEVPDYLQAEIQRQAAEQAAVNAEEAQRQQERAMLSQNLMGGAMLYNQAMGDRTPIADALRDWTGGGSAETAIPAALNPASATPQATPQLFGGGFEQGSPIGEAMPVQAPVADIPAGQGALLPTGEGVPTEAGGAMDAMSKAAPYLAALRGGQQALEGDIGGLLGTGAKYYLSTLGPWGMGAALGASLLGL